MDKTAIADLKTCSVSLKNIILTCITDDNLFNTSCEVLSKISTEILKKNVVVRFQGEPGVVCCQKFYF